MIKSNYEIIKRIVEKNARVKKLDITGHYDGVALIRYIYYQLCFNYIGKKYSHTAAAKLLKRDHNNSRYGLRAFKKLKNQKFFKSYIEIYNDSYSELLQLEAEINKIIKGI